MGSKHSLPIQRCLYDVGSPGQAFKLNEAVLMDYLDDLEVLLDHHIHISETAGLNSIICKGILANDLAEKLKLDYYGRKGK